jgi:uncharacterized RDD family membrane protein YckC
MKCPKCGYIGFEEVDRCKNCGYDFALSAPADVSDLELPLRADGPGGPSGDLSLDTPHGLTSRVRKGVTPPRALELDRLIGDRSPTPSDLPLFGEIEPGADDFPFLSASKPSRPPLAVRRTTPPPARPRTPSPVQLESRSLDLEPAAREAEPAPQTASAREPAQSAGAGPRVLAALIDGGLLLVLDAIVLYFTLRLCRLAISEMAMLPAAPLAGFLALLNGGYFVAFTAAGGQTIGKMATGTRVVGEDDQAVSFGQATVRTLAYLASALPAGLGFVVALIGQGRRGLHDRLAGTRVVRVATL